MSKYSYKDYFKRNYKAHHQIEDAQLHSRFLYNQLEFIHSKVPLEKYYDKPVLEIGSGLGSMALLLLEKGFKKYQALEMDADMAKSTNETIGPFFNHSSLEEFAPNHTNMYSIVCAFEVLEHLINPIQGIEMIYSLLKKEGFFIGTSPYPFKKNILADQTHTFVLHPTNWKKLFLDNNFSNVQTFPMTYTPYIWRLHKKANIRIPFYVPFKYVISTTLIIAKK